MSPAGRFWPSLLGWVLLLAPAAVADPWRDALRSSDTGGLETRSAALILSGEEGGEIEVSLLPMPVAAAAAGTRVALWVEIDGASLLAGPEAGEILLEVYAYALAANDELAAFMTQAFALDRERHGETLRRGGVKFLGHLDLAPGAYSLRLLVQQRRGDRFSLRVAPLAVPPWDGAETLLLPPLFPEPPGRWVLVREAGAETLAAGEEPLLPAARPVVAGAGEAPFTLAGRRLPDAFTARLVSAESRPVELTLGERRRQGDWELIAARLGASGSPPGEYRLEIVPAGATAPVAAVPLVLLDAQELPPWNAARRILRRAANDTAQATAPPPSAAEAGSAELVAGYLEAFRLLAAGDPGAARSAASRLERAAVGSGTEDELKRLGTAQKNTLGKLTRRRTEALLPILELYDELYRDYHRRRRYQLATHARTTLALLDTTLLAAKPAPEIRGAVAAARTSRAGYLLEMGATLAALPAFESVLEIDPAAAPALLGLAIIHESYGSYDRAVEHLERLLRITPGEPASAAEARLRLAVNQRRLGVPRRAEELFRSCLAPQSPEWVRILATQELADLQLAESRPRQAAELLEEALRLLPQQQRLHIQLAAVYDRLGRDGEAREVLRRLDPRAGRQADSPRLRYSRWPTAAIQSARRQLAQAAAAHRADLAAAVAAVAQRRGS